MNLFSGIYLFFLSFYQVLAWTLFKNKKVYHLFGDLSKVSNLNLSESPIELVLFSFHFFFLFAGVFSILFCLLNWKKFPWLIFDLGVFSIFYGICSILTSPLIHFFIKNSNTIELLFVLFVNIVYLPLLNGFLRLKDFQKNRLLIALFYLNTIVSVFNIILLFGIDSSSELKMNVEIFAILTLIIHKLNILIPLVISINNGRKNKSSSWGTIISLALTLVFMFLEIILREYFGITNLPLTSFGIIFCLIALVYSLGKKYFLDLDRVKLFEQNFSDLKYHLLLAQMNPHFLFNALNTIHSFLENKSPNASKAIILLSGLYRMVQQLLNEKQSTVSQELSFLRKYLEFQKLRFPKKLKFKFNTDLELENSNIPSFILQPLVENSINHGYMGSERRFFEITINTKRIGAKQGLIEIIDNGSGIAPDILANDSILFARSLGNIKRRLEFSSSNNELIIFSSNLGTTIKILFEIHIP